MKRLNLSTITDCLNYSILRLLIHRCNSLPRGKGCKEADLCTFKRIALVFFAFFSIALWAPPVAAAFSIEYQAPADPITEGFSSSYCCGGTPFAGPIANDQGLPAWYISGSAQSTQFVYYSGITATQKADIANQGFILTLKARVLPGIAPAFDTTNYAVIGGATLNTTTRRFDIELGLDVHGDTVVVLPTYIDSPAYLRAVGPSYTLTGSGSSYHDYQLVYNPSTQLADLFVDGVERIQGYGGLLPIYPEDYGLMFGGWSGGQANFNLVRLTSPVVACNGLIGETLQICSSYEFYVEQSAQKTQFIQLINPGTISRSASPKIVNPHPELAIALQSQNPVTIAPGAIVTVPLQINATSAAVGVYDGILLEVAIDDGSKLYANITVHVTEPGAAAQPDLTVSSEDISSVDGNYVVTIHNQGNAPASQVTVQFSDFGDSLGETVIPNIPPNGSATTSITPPASPPGERLIEVVINHPNSTTHKRASRIFHPSGPTEGNILVRGDLPPQVCPSSLFSVGGVAVYDLTVNGVKNTDYAVKGGSVQIKTSWTTLYGDIHTDVNGAFSRFLLAPASPGSYSVTMTVTDTTFSGTGQFVFEVAKDEDCPPGAPGPIPRDGPPINDPVDGWYVLEQILHLWQWMCSGDNCNQVPAQDVYVYSEHMAFSNTHPNPNEQITIGAQIHYFATDPALSSGKVQVNFYASTPGASRAVLPPRVIDSISAGSARNAFTTWKAPTDGIYIIEAEAVPTQLVENTLNNAATRAIIVGPYESGKGVISGQVRTNSGGVKGVTISISATNSAVTDATGFYYLEQVPVGDYQVKISNVPTGYLADAETQAATVTDQSVSTVDFHLTKQTGDIIPPVLKLPDAITAEATGPSGAVVTYTATATDNVDGEIIPSCVPASDSTFSFGTTTVNCTAKDQAGNTAQGSFTVTVRDTTPPTITGSASPAANANGWNNKAVTVSFTCNDAASGIATCTAPQTLSGEGANQAVNGTATDKAGNTASAQVTGINLDLTAPVVSVTGVSNGATYTRGTVLAPGCNTTDAPSGVQTKATVSVTGGNPNGVGTFTATCKGAIDKAGNAGKDASVTYKVTGKT